MWWRCWRPSSRGTANQRDETIRDLLRDVLPNFPDALAEEWLAPYVNELGAPSIFWKVVEHPCW